MREQLYQLLENSAGSTAISFETLVLRIFVAAVIGMVIFVSYWASHAGTIYSQKFNVNLVIMTILTSTVVTIIGNNIALSLGMVGALSIVRFRTAIKDARDTAYIFWAIVVGIACGAGGFTSALVGSAVVFLIMLVLGRIRNDVRTLIVIRAARAQELAIEGLIYEYFHGRASQRVKNTTEDSVEFMFEIRRKTLDKHQLEAENTITDELYALGGVEYVNIVAQADEIGS